VRYLSLNELLALHSRVIVRSGGAMGVLNLPGLASALAQPLMLVRPDDHLRWAVLTPPSRHAC
jgi:hypothetical protein